MAQNSGPIEQPDSVSADQVDLLGQPAPDFQEFNATDKSCRELGSRATLRQGIRKRGGKVK